MGYPSLRAVGRRVRSRLLRCWIHDLPRLLAPLVRGKGVWGSLAFGFILLLSGLGLPEIPDVPVELYLPPLKISFPLKDLAPYGVGAGLTLFALGLLGLGARGWAVPRARFWEEMEARGIRVVWDGEARDFRERLDEALGFSLGRGPTGRLLHAYVPRPEEEEILRFLRERVWGPEKQAFGVVIAGPPVAGKTRTAMELVIRLNLPFVLVWPRGRKEGPSSFPGGVALPVPRAVVLADDLPLRPGGEGSSLPEELTALLSACPGLALIATARRDRIPPDARGVRVVALQGMGWDERLEQLAQEVARAEGQPLAEVKRRFTDHPGSLVAGLDRFRQRYDQLHEEMGRVLGVPESARRDRLGEIGRRFLQAARALWDLGVRTLSLERIWAAVEKAGGETVAVADRSEVQRALEELAFLWVERGKRPEVVRFYEGMLTEVIPSGDGWWERTVWETLRDRKDAAAFVEIGNAWSEEYSSAYQRNPREALRKAIAAYGEALYFYTPDVAPLDYAKTQNDLGVAYLRLSEHEDPVGNLRRAIEAFEQALRFWTPDVAPLDYARAQSHLGSAYGRLSEHEDPVGNLRRAIEAFKQALRFRTPDVAPLDYAKTQNNLGSAYGRLSEHEDPVGNLRRAIKAFEQALRFWTPDVAPLDYATIQNNLGVAYLRLSEHEDPVGNLRRAIEAFEQALRFQTPDVAPLNYAKTQNNLGVAYRCLSEHEDPVGNLRRAIEAFEEALRFWTPDVASLNYATIQNNLGVAYRCLSEHEDPAGNLRRAIKAFEEALRFRTPERTPLFYARTQHGWVWPTGGGRNSRQTGPSAAWICRRRSGRSGRRCASARRRPRLAGTRRPAKPWRRPKKPSAGPDAPGAPEAVGPATGGRPEPGALPPPAPRWNPRRDPNVLRLKASPERRFPCARCEWPCSS
jgi:tetratricopeptide (TPR) repeat protein